jgi:hypothetical protein
MAEEKQPVGWSEVFRPETRTALCEDERRNALVLASTVPGLTRGQV